MQYVLKNSELSLYLDQNNYDTHVLEKIAFKKST
jgi:hypothetical protein